MITYRRIPHRSTTFALSAIIFWTSHVCILRAFSVNLTICMNCFNIWRRKTAKIEFNFQLHASNCIVHRNGERVDLGLKRIFYERKRKKTIPFTVEPGVSNTLEIYEVPEDNWPNSVAQDGDKPEDFHTLFALFMQDYEEIASSETVTGTFGRL